MTTDPLEKIATDGAIAALVLEAMSAADPCDFQAERDTLAKIYAARIREAMAIDRERLVAFAAGAVRSGIAISNQLTAYTAQMESCESRVLRCSRELADAFLREFTLEKTP